MTDLAAFWSGVALVMIACAFPRPTLALAGLTASILNAVHMFFARMFKFPTWMSDYHYALQKDGDFVSATGLWFMTIACPGLVLFCALIALIGALLNGTITISLSFLAEPPCRHLAVFALGLAAPSAFVFAFFALVEAVWRKIESRDDVFCPFTPDFDTTIHWRLYALFGLVPGNLPVELARGPYGKARLSAFGNNFPWTATIGQGLLDQSKVATRYHDMWMARAAYHLHPAGKDLSTEDVHAVNFNYTSSNVNDDICIGFNACFLVPRCRASLGQRLAADVAIARIVIVALASAAWSKLAPVVFAARDAALFAFGVVTGLAGFAYDTWANLAQTCILAAQRDLGLAPMENSFVGALVVARQVARILAADLLSAVRPSGLALSASCTALFARVDTAIAQAIPQLGSVGGAIALQARDSVYARLVCVCSSFVQRAVRFALRLPGMVVDHVFACIANLAMYAVVCVSEAAWAFCPSWQQALHVLCRASVHPALLVLRVAFFARTVVLGLAAAMLAIAGVFNWTVFLVYCGAIAFGCFMACLAAVWYSIQLRNYVGFAVRHAVRTGEWHVVFDRLVEGIDYREDVAYCVKWDLVDVTAHELCAGPSRWWAREGDFRVTESSTSRVDHMGRLISQGLDGSYRFYLAGRRPEYH